MSKPAVSSLRLAVSAAALMAALISGAMARDLTITTWTATSPGLQDWWKVITGKYQEQNLDVKVKVENIAFGEYIKTLTTRMIAGSPPDVIHVPLPTSNLPAWAEAGFLKPVDEKIAGTDIASSWPPSQSAMAWNGVNYGVLLTQYGYVFFVNERMFKDAGIALPKTKEELLAAAKALTGNGRYGFALTDDNTVNFTRDALEFVTGFGGQWVKDGQWNFTDPVVVSALDMWRDIALNYAPRGTDFNAKRQSFYDGNVAMMIENPSVWANVAAAAKPDVVGDLHLAPMPFETVPGDVSHGLSIPADASAEDAELAWKFIALAASPEMMRAYVELVRAPVARPGVSDSLGSTRDTRIIAESAAKAKVLIPNDYFGVRANFAAFASALTDALRSILQGTPTADAMKALGDGLTAKGIRP